MVPLYLTLSQAALKDSKQDQFKIFFLKSDYTFNLHYFSDLDNGQRQVYRQRQCLRNL